MMKELQQTIIAFLRERETWIYTGAVLFISLIQTNEGPVQSWSVYLSYVVSLLLLFAPVLLFTWYRPRLREQLSRRRYQALWAACFLVYAPLVGSLRINLGLPLLFAGPTEALDLLTGLALLLIELALGGHRFLRQRLPRVEWIRQLSLEKGLLLGLLGLALLHSTIAIASYDTFSQTGVIGAGPVDMRNFLFHFPAWLGMSLQLFIAFLVVYFFYFVNHHILIPGLLKDKGVLFYFFGVVGTVVLFYPFLTQLLKWLPLHSLLGLAPSGGGAAVEGINGAVAFMIMVFSLPVILAVEWAKQNHAIVSLEQQRTQTELGLLKQQINPHFFFNTLNNLYALSIRKSDQTPEVVMQLSELMRYVIYRGKEAFVPLAEEIAYVEDYIRLQQIRLHKRLDLSITKHIADPELTISPLLLIVLVENAFKHGIEPAEGNCRLHLHLETLDHELTFICENSYEAEPSNKPGIGLDNLRRRLDLIYPGRHDFEIHDDGRRFTTILKIDLA